MGGGAYSVWIILAMFRCNKTQVYLSAGIYNSRNYYCYFFCALNCDRVIKWHLKGGFAVEDISLFLSLVNIY